MGALELHVRVHVCKCACVCVKQSLVSVYYEVKFNNRRRRTVLSACSKLTVSSALSSGFILLMF